MTKPDGVFLRFCEKAVRNPERPYFFLIDEINRGNLSRIFGETMLLIESDKRSPEYAVELSHQKADEGAFFIPANVHLIGMMNTADRSLAMVDYALRRRFVFFDIEPAFSYERFKQHLQKRNMSEKLIEAIILRMNKINEEIVSDTGSLGAGYRIGHSFFCPDHTTDLDETWYRQVIRYEIEPLLREYWFDKPDNVAKAVEFLSQDI